jgi:rubrerythrin
MTVTDLPPEAELWYIRLRARLLPADLVKLDKLVAALRLRCKSCNRLIEEHESQWGTCPECAESDPEFLS